MSVNIRNPITGDLTNVAGDTINPKSINEMIAPVEDGTASKAYAVGEQFIMNDLLCEATQAIAQGDTMVIGTNCEESEQLSKQVKDINTSLTANGNRFEAGYSSENDEYGFNIGSTFYPIGASSGGGVMVDTALDSTSENPVQNKVITGEINDIKSDLGGKVDSSQITPTNGAYVGIVANVGGGYAVIVTLPNNYISDYNITCTDVDIAGVSHAAPTDSRKLYLNGFYGTAAQVTQDTVGRMGTLTLSFTPIN